MPSPTPPRLPGSLACAGLLATALIAAAGAAGSRQADAAGGVSLWTGAEAFAAGPLLVDRMASHGHQVFAVRRDAPGAVEQHALDTDIVLVLDGAATFVTGGTVADARTRGANEVTGSGIGGGTDRRLDKGDVVIVPNGVPHWFREVSPSIRYYAVKLRQAGAGVRVPAEVQHWKGADAFAKGGTIFQAAEGPFARVYALRRDKPLGVELHALDTDVVFVVGGTGTFFTGGSIVEPRPLAPNESTGSALAAGTPRALAPGSVLMVPAGTPHWLRDVAGPLEFFAIKLR